MTKLICLLLLCASAWGAIAYRTMAGTTAAASAQFTPVAGDLVVVLCSRDAANSSAFNVPTDTAGATYVYSGVAVDNIDFGGSIMVSSRMYYTLNHPGYTNNVVTCSMGGGTYPRITIAAYSGVATSAAFDATASAGTVSNTVTTSQYSTSTANQVAVVLWRMSGTGAASSTFTVRTTASANGGGDDILSATVTNATEQVTNSGGRGIIIVGTFKELSGGAARRRAVLVQ